MLFPKFVSNALKTTNLKMVSVVSASKQLNTNTPTYPAFYNGALMTTQLLIIATYA